MKKIKNQKKGQGLVEYVLLVALIALVSIAALTGMGSSVNDGFFSNISTNLDSANTKIENSP
ncbi:MAG: Flp family type IVb pilin [Candidatus Rifleibacteriota bacterium]